MIDSQAQRAVIDYLIVFSSTTLNFQVLKWCFKNNQIHKYGIIVYIVIWSFVIFIVNIFRAYAFEDRENYVLLFAVTMIMSAGFYMSTLMYNSVKESFCRGEDLKGWREILLFGCILCCLFFLFFFFFRTNNTGLIVSIICIVLSVLLFTLWDKFYKIVYKFERKIEQIVTELKKDISKLLNFLNINN